MTRRLIEPRMTAVASLPRVAELGLGGQLMLCAARTWTAGEVSGVASPCALFRCAGLAPDAFAAFASLLALLSACPSGPGFGSIHDAWLSEGEEQLVEAIGALQAGEPWRAQRIIAGWVPPAAAPRAVGLMASIARSLADAALPITTKPDRPVVH
ncbi:hypothetical protein [Elioraea rosea]|uniref:hypothetical protein n=1 Tax=Elioraea rosea TaxID=2492390 RepID=UPI0011823461|nr:hypothetical protein [Elioraea rosea]